MPMAKTHGYSCTVRDAETVVCLCNFTYAMSEVLELVAVTFCSLLLCCDMKN